MGQLTAASGRRVILRFSCGFRGQRRGDPLTGRLNGKGLPAVEVTDALSTSSVFPFKTDAWPCPYRLPRAKRAARHCPVPALCRRKTRPYFWVRRQMKSGSTEVEPLFAHKNYLYKTVIDYMRTCRY